ncbi:MAG: hypothetical protein OEW27_17785 [Aquincola sp.]|nr:hypothetical protein [Aquincola sp.]MDH5331799.1 hypothetical protein [Aquincola sp.]
MSFLEQLKQQARTIQAEAPTERAEVVARNRRLALGACELAHGYWKELCEQLNVIRPPSAARYLIDGRNALRDLVCGQFRTVPNMRMLPGGQTQYDGVMLAWVAANGRSERIEKELPKDIERVRGGLRQAGIQASEVAVRHPTTGRFLATAFEFKAEVHAHVRVVPLTDSGRVRLTFTNIDQLERVDAEYPAVGLRQRLLDEIGRWIVGQPQHVLQYATEVRRYQN